MGVIFAYMTITQYLSICVHDSVSQSPFGWWLLFVCVHPDNMGEMIQFDYNNIFQVGWNRQEQRRMSHTSPLGSLKQRLRKRTAVPATWYERGLPPQWKASDLTMGMPSVLY